MQGSILQQGNVKKKQYSTYLAFGVDLAFTLDLDLQ